MKLVVLSGSGISAESGIPTFRGSGGLWEGMDVMQIATPEAWRDNPARVLRFYNERRAGVIQAQPNAGHLALAALQQHFDVHIITQNVDDLHERAGSQNILHLHGEIRKARSTIDDSLVYPLEGSDISPGDTCEKGSQLRPHIVWFGESVPNLPLAEKICAGADVLIICGTSLQVYPAAGLIHSVPESCTLYVVDPDAPAVQSHRHTVHFLKMPASKGLPLLAEQLIKQL